MPRNQTPKFQHAHYVRLQTDGAQPNAQTYPLQSILRITRAIGVAFVTGGAGAYKVQTSKRADGAGNSADA